MTQQMVICGDKPAPIPMKLAQVNRDLQTCYAFVIDKESKRLSPTKVNKAWYLIRKGKADLIELYPMVIRLNRVIPSDQVDNNPVVLGIDDGASKVGIALVQECKKQRTTSSYRKTKNKVLFSGVIYLSLFSTPLKILLSKSVKMRALIPKKPVFLSEFSQNPCQI